MTTVLASAADERYGYWLLNLIGSVNANARGFDRIAVYDLGLSPRQRQLLEQVRGIEVLAVPPFVPHWREGRTWKAWIWCHVAGDRVLWLDAGVTVLRPLDEMLAQVDERDYVVVSAGHPVGDIVPDDYYELYGFPRDRAQRTSITAGILGFRTASEFSANVLAPTYDDCVAGRSVGFSPSEVAKLNVGLDRTTAPVVRNARLFRHEQTLLNIHFHSWIDDPVVNDVYKYGGWQSPHDHPEQLLWNHRRRGDYRYLHRVPFRWPFAPLGRAWGLAFRWRWWKRTHSWLFRPATYANKARRVLTSVGRQ